MPPVAHRASTKIPAKVTKLRQKVIDIWSYVKERSDAGKVNGIPAPVLLTCLRQHAKFEALKAKDKETNDKRKARAEEMTQEMANYEDSVGAHPPADG